MELTEIIDTPQKVVANRINLVSQFLAVLVNLQTNIIILVARFLGRGRAIYSVRVAASNEFNAVWDGAEFVTETAGPFVHEFCDQSLVRTGIKLIKEDVEGLFLFEVVAALWL